MSKKSTNHSEGRSNDVMAFFIKSQKKIDSLKKKLETLSKKNQSEEENQKIVVKKSDKKDIQEVKVVISVTSVIKATLAILLLMGLVNILGVIKKPVIIFAAALLLSATLRPAVDRLHDKKVPRALGIILIYILIIGVFVVLFSSLIPIIARQLGQIALSVKDIVENLITGKNTESWIVQQIQPYLSQFWVNVDQSQLISSVSDSLGTLASNLRNLAGNAVGAIIAIFNGIFNLFLVLIVTFFMILHSKHTQDFFHSLFPHRYSAYISLKSQQISNRLGEWVRGQLLLALAMGLLTFVFFSIIGLDYAVTLSMVSALAEFIPYLGPIITFSSAALIGFNQDPVLVVWLIGAYAILQFLEGNFLVPLIVGRAVGLNPIVVIFALLTGASLGFGLGGSVGLGILGMIVAVPIANIISLFVEDYTEKNK